MREIVGKGRGRDERRKGRRVQMIRRGKGGSEGGCRNVGEGRTKERGRAGGITGEGGAKRREGGIKMRKGERGERKILQGRKEGEERETKPKTKPKTKRRRRRERKIYIVKKQIKKREVEDRDTKGE